MKTNGIPFWENGAPPVLEPILVGIGCSLGVQDFDPWPNPANGYSSQLAHSPVCFELVEPLD